MDRVRAVTKLRAIPHCEGPCERCGRVTAGWLCGTCNARIVNVAGPLLVYGGGAPTADAEKPASVRIFRKRPSNPWSNYVPGPGAA